MADSTSENPYVVIQTLEEVMDELSAHMDLKEFKEALDIIITFLARKKEAPNHIAVAGYVTQLAAYGTVFRVQAANYMSWKKGTQNASYYKNCYIALYHGIDELVAALKYWNK